MTWLRWRRNVYDVHVQLQDFLQIGSPPNFQSCRERSVVALDGPDVETALKNL